MVAVAAPAALADTRPGNDGNGAPRIVLRQLAQVITSNQQLQQQLAGKGYSNIQVLRRVNQGAQSFYVAEASRAGQRYTLVVNAQTGQFRGRRILKTNEAASALGRAGYGNVQNLRRGRRGVQAIYSGQANQGGQKFDVTVNGYTGKVINRRPVRGVAPPLTRAQLMQRLQRAGFRDIKNLRQRRTPGRTIWTANATKGNQRCAHLIDGANGKVLRSARCQPVGLNRQQVQTTLQRGGFRNVRNLRQLPNGNWTALATRRGQAGTVNVAGTSGRISFTPGSAGPLTAAQMRAKLTTDGFTNIVKFRTQRRGARVFYTAEAERRGRRFSIRARASDGRYLSRDIGPALVRPVMGRFQIQVALARQGFTNISNITRGTVGGQPVFTAIATRRGQRLNIVANARTGTVIRTTPATARLLTATQLRQALARQRFSAVRKILRGSIGRRPVFTVEATRAGRRFQVVADGRTGRVINAQPLAGTVLTARQIRAVLSRRGFSRIRNLQLTRVGGTQVYVGQARRNGQAVDIVVDGRSGRVLQSQPIATGIMSPRQVVRTLRGLGWQRIRNIRLTNRGGRQMYLAVAVMSSVAQSSPVLKPAQIRLALTLLGYWRVRDFQLFTRNGQQFYRLKARRNGRALRLLVRADTGAVVSSRPDGPKLLSPAQIQTRVARAGFTRIRILRQTGGSGSPTYLVRGRQAGKIWLLVVNAQNGAITNRRVLRSLVATPGDVSVVLSRLGYKHVTGIQVLGGNRANQIYVARGWKDGALWRLNLNTAATRLLSRQRIGGRMNEGAIERRLIAAGYRNVDILRWRPGSRAGTYVAVAMQGQTKYRLRVNALNGSVSSRRQINQSRTPVEIIRRLARLAGFHYLTNLNWQGGQGIYRGEAWQKGYRWRIWVRARDGNIVRRQRLGGRTTLAKARQRLTAFGYSDIDALRFVDNRREGYFVGVAERNNEKFRVFARASDGRPTRTVLLSRRLSKQAVERRILADGYERHEDVEYAKGKGDGHYEGFAWKNGLKFRLKVRAADGQIFRRTLIDPRANKAAIEDTLFNFGYDRNEQIRFVEDNAGGHFEVIAWRGGRKYQLFLRAHDGTIYRREQLAK
jgi:uncharacterized membrane protein YkoI